MGIFKRIGSLVKSNAHDLVNKAEDPEKMLNQAILDMGNQLSDAKKQVAEAIADEKRLHRQWEAELERTRGWKEKAVLAVRAGEDGLAKEALTRRKDHEALAEQYQKQWEAQKDAVEKLKASLRGLNDKIEAAKRKKNLLVAKKRRAEAQKSVQETMSGIGADGAFDTFERMERRIEQDEAEAESLAELAGERTGDTLGERFAVLESKTGEDMDLLALKEEMGLIGGGERESEAPRLEAARRASAKSPAEVDEAVEGEDVEPSSGRRGA